MKRNYFLSMKNSQYFHTNRKFDFRAANIILESGLQQLHCSLNKNRIHNSHRLLSKMALCRIQNLEYLR